MLIALVKLFELPEDDSVPEDEHFIEIEDTPGYQTAYSRLNFAGKAEQDPLKGKQVDNLRIHRTILKCYRSNLNYFKIYAETVPNAKVFLAQSLGKLNVSAPGKIGPLTASMPPEVQTFLMKYLNEAGVQLA